MELEKENCRNVVSKIKAKKNQVRKRLRHKSLSILLFTVLFSEIHI